MTRHRFTRCLTISSSENSGTAKAQSAAVKGNIAHVKVVGKAQGINLGAPVTMLVNAHYEFDVKAQCVTFLQWNETDARQQGPVAR